MHDCNTVDVELAGPQVGGRGESGGDEAGGLTNRHTVTLCCCTLEPKHFPMKYFPILKLKWEHRAAEEKEWTEYPPEHSKQLFEVHHQQQSFG